MMPRYAFLQGRDSVITAKIISESRWWRTAIVFGKPFGKSDVHCFKPQKNQFTEQGNLHELNITHLGAIALSGFASNYTRIPATPILIARSKLIKKFL